MASNRENESDPALEALVDKLGTDEMETALAERREKKRQEEANKKR